MDMKKRKKEKRKKTKLEEHGEDSVHPETLLKGGNEGMMKYKGNSEKSCLKI